MTGAKARVQTASAGQAEVACPACGAGRIAFIPQALAAGRGFACDACGAELSLGAEAQALYCESLDKLEALRAEAAARAG